MSEKRRSIFQVIFGDDIGKMLGVMIGMFVLVIFFMSLPRIMMFVLGTSKSESSKILEQLPPDTKSVIEELAKVQSKTQGLLSKLQNDVQQSEILLEEKKKALSDIQVKTDMLKLTPDQLRLIEEYNKSVSRDPTLLEWVKRKSTWYEIIAGFIVSFFFYRLGVRKGEKLKLHKFKT